jgi:predicted dehydrogenase
MSVGERKLKVALVGVGFGAEFAPIYNAHPDVEWVALTDTNSEKLAAACSRFGIEKTYPTLEAILADPEVEAVHLVTPIPLHAGQAVKVLEAGKHCACTVPMATSFDDIRRIVAAQKKSGKNYMMMETAAYTRQGKLVRTAMSGLIAQLSRLQPVWSVAQGDGQRGA